MAADTGDNLIDFHTDTTGAAAFTAGTEHEWGRAMVPAGSMGTGAYLQPWTTETTRAVTAGTAATFDLKVRRQKSMTAANCYGTYFATVYTGTL